jgi:hypothetical protein
MMRSGQFAATLESCLKASRLPEVGKEIAEHREHALEEHEAGEHDRRDAGSRS